MKAWLLLLTVSLTATLARAQSGPLTARLAVVVEDSSLGEAGDMLTLELSRRNDLQMLERAEIDKIYREQTLSAAGNDYLKLGQVLGAEGLVVLTALREGTNQFLGLRFIAVKSGVMLASERFPWPLAGTAEWAAGVSHHLGPLIPKASVLVKDAIPISIVNLRSAVQSDQGRELERQLTVLIVDRLSRERELFVLERRNMQLLTAETVLKGLEDAGFWQGSFLLEGTLDREVYSAETLTISARLIPPKGGAPQPIELSCSRTNLAAGVNQLAEKIIAALKLRGTAVPWNSADEAEQFFFDAKWAYRWGLLAQAQAASESAWALGKRTQEAALLRIRAYAEDGWPVYDWSGNINIPGLPDPTTLKALVRALELFACDSKAVFTNSAPLDEEWYLTGLRLFRKSAAILDGFYHWAELREPCQAQLAEARSLSRQLLSILETQAPFAPGADRNRNAHGRPLLQGISVNLSMFDQVKWHEGGLLFERPEDSLPMFRGMLDKSYAPVQLPRIVGWTWEDRKRAPAVLRQFIQDLCASTNAPTKLSGLMLGLAKTLFYPEASFHERENALLAGIWEYRTWILSRADHAAVVARAEDILRNKYADWDPNAYFGREPFADLRHRLWKEFLLTATNFDYQAFQVIFGRNYLQMPPAEARDLALAMDALSAKDNLASRIREQLCARAGMAVKPSEPSVANPPMPAEEPVTAKFIRWRAHEPDSESAGRPYFERLIVRNDKLFAMAAYLRQNETFSFHPPSFCLCVDPQTGSYDGIPFPQKLGPPDDSFEVAPDCLYVSAQDRLERYRFGNKTWETIPVPMQGGAQLISLSGRLYLSTAASLLELDPDSHATRIIASSRRQPALNDLDSLLNSSIRLYARDDGKLGIMASNQFLAFDPATHTLKASHLMPPSAIRSSKVAFFSAAGAQMRVSDGMGKRSLLGFWNNSETAELLLEQYHPPPGFRQAVNLTNGAAPARWEWPPLFDVEASSILADGKSLWILSPRKVWHQFGHTSEEPVRFTDARQATLFRFEPNIRLPFSIPIVFDKNDQDIEPFDPFRGGFSFLRQADRARAGELPCWLTTSSGLVLSAPTLGGHWLIARSALESRLAVLRARPPKPSAATNPLPSKPASARPRTDESRASAKP